MPRVLPRRRDRRLLSTCGLLLACAVLGAVGCSRSGEPREAKRAAVAGEPDLKPGMPVTFNRHIAPIVFEKCAACHRPGESAPFSLLTYADVKRRTKLIREVTQSHYMPPWLPERGTVEFAGTRALTEKQIEAIARWIDSGAAEGDARDLPAPPRWKDGWQLGEPDLVVEMPEPYTLPPEGTDLFRNFVVPVPLDRDRFVRAIEFRPGNAKVIHHAVIMIDRSRTSRERDAEDPEPGFEGMEGKGSIGSPDGHFLGWSPGKMPSVAPADMAWRLHQGSDFVLMLHLLPGGKPESVRAKIGLYFTDTPPTREAVILRLGSEAMEIPAGEANYRVADEFRLPVDVDAFMVYPHAHYLGREMKGAATLPDGSTQSLLHIKSWDFNWQDEYRFARPVRLPKGTVLRMDFSYDNSAANPRNRHSPPRRVLYGSRSEDEMSTLWFQLVPRHPADLPELKQAVLQKRLDLEVAGFHFAVQANPGDARAHNNLGVLHNHLRRPQEARQRFEEAVRLNPRYAAAHYNLGVLQLGAGEEAAALASFERTVALAAHHVNARINLGSLLEKKGSLAAAEEQFARALAVEDHPTARHNLGVVQFKRGKFEDAKPHLVAALATAPEDPNLLYSLGVACFRLNALTEATVYLEKLIPLVPRNAEVHNVLGAVQLRQGNARAAAASFKRALALQPQDAQIAENLKLAERAIGLQP